MENIHGPCIEKDCSSCCNPVKISSRDILNGRILSKKSDGTGLWIKRNEVLVTESRPESKINTFDCVNFDKISGRCLDYDNRPNKCKSSSCLNVGTGNDDEKFKCVTDQKFIKINPIKLR